MELTVDQILQQGIAAHKEGKVQDAERLYRAILESQPLYPDANHNLGVLAVSVNKADAALPLFKTALEANPKIEQFWLSYIDALIKTEKIDDARRVLADAQQAGVTAAKLQIFEERLEFELSPSSHIPQQEISNPLHSRQGELSAAIELREVGKYTEAQEWLSNIIEHDSRNSEALSLLSQVFLLDKKEVEAERALTAAASINSELPSVYRNQARLLLKQSKTAEALEKAQLGCRQSPDDSESLLVLAACLGANQRDLEALPIIEKILKAKSNYAEAYANRALIKLRAKDTVGAIEDAEMTVSLKPHLTQMWFLLSSLYYQDSNLSDAIEALRSAHKNEPGNPAFMVQLGELLRQDNKASEAINILEQATELAPKDANAWTNLGVAFQQEKRIADAKIAYEKALALNPKSAAIASNLGAMAQEAEEWKSALQYFGKALEIEPNLAEAHSNLGITLKELGRLEEAEASCRQAISLKPDYATAHSNLGVTLQELGRLDEAEASLRQAISLKSDFAEARYNLGNTLQELGRLDEAEASYTRAIAVKPDYAVAHNNLGATLQELGRLGEAEASCRQAISLKSDYATAHNNLGATLQELGRLDEAEASCRQAISLKSDYATAHSNLGNTLQELGRLDEAEASLRQAIALKPDYAKAHNNLGNTLQELGRLDEAEASLRQAIALKPDYAKAHNNLGATLQELGRLDEAEASLRQAIALKPDYAKAHNNLGITLKELGRLDEAEASLRQAISLKPDYATAHSNLGVTLQELGRLDEALTSYNQAIEIKIDISETYSNKYFCLNCFPSGSPLSIFEQHLEFEKQFGGLQIEPILNPRSNLRVEKRLRVGYVSGDFRKHSVAYFFEPLLQHHNSNAVETFCYYNNFPIDEMTKRLMATSDHWRPIVGITDSDVANLIRNDKIDILVDLSGHTSKNRLLVFARKPAPIQVTWLGYPNTTGLSAIDYRFTDIIADPMGKADELHSESLVRLANGFQCYKGNKAVHSNSELPFKRQGYITFGSFNNLTKVTPEVIRVWSHILHAVPKSCLVLKAKQLKYNANHYLDCFKKEGITEDRITLHGRMPSTHDHLELYNTIDICLDPFPFNGATTTCEALWMGVPVVTLSGDRHVGRVGASILTNVGLADFIAQDIDGYIQLAVEKASNTNYLADIRKGLRERMLEAPLCDARSFANDVESAYQKMWHCYQE